MKKIISVLLIITLAFSMFAGCAKKETAEEIFKGIFENEKVEENFSFKEVIKVTSDDLTPEIGIAGPIEISINGDVFDTESMKFKANINAGGMNIEGDIYYANKEILVTSPFLASFLNGISNVRLNLDDLAELSGVDTFIPTNNKKIIDIIKRFSKDKGYSITDILNIAEEVEKVEVDINDKTKKLTKVTAEIKGEDLINIGFEFMNFIINDDEAKDVFFANLDEEQMKEMITAFEDEELKANKEELLKNTKFNELSLVMYVDADKNVFKTEFKMDIAMMVEEVETAFVVEVQFDKFNVASVEKIELPEVNEDEVLNLADMLK